ncbi:MAG: UDP-N-acetylmuramoyl-tripeptide--D-alanyl-D-alanine ligase [Vicinamibacteria bacterium]
MRILESLSWAEIMEALSARALGAPGRAPRGASIDTRTLEPGDIFFALKGEHVDGHAHAASAFEKGASCAVIKDPGRAVPGFFSLVVADPEIALFELGRLIRSRSSAIFVAITGSAGKTTTKEFTTEILRDRGPVLATRGNLNNHLGVPLTLSRLETEHWAAVIECGMSHRGELSRLSHLVRPKVAVVTNVAAAHLEFFSSLDGIAAEKADIFSALGPGDIAVAPSDEPLLLDRTLRAGGEASFFGPGDRSSMAAVEVEMSLDGSRFRIESGGARASVFLPVPGPHAISNFLAAAVVGRSLGLPLDAIANRAKSLLPGGNRGAVKRLHDDILLIDDSYNSNPRALRSALDTLALAKGRRKVACLGDMLELGPTSAALHREAGGELGARVDLLLCVGVLAREIAAGADRLPEAAKRMFSDSAELAAQVNELVRSRDAVLVKGSRGVRMERVVEALLAAHPGVPA